MKKEIEEDKTVTYRTIDYFCVTHPLRFNTLDELLEHYQDSHLMTNNQAKDFHNTYKFDVKGWDLNNDKQKL
jgi:hypothetical protein